MSVSFQMPGGTAVTIQNPDLQDKLDQDSHQVIQPKAGGGFYRYALAETCDTQREMRWTNLRLSELTALRSFFSNQAQGTLNEFTFTDERGQQWAAYFLNAVLDPITVSDDPASTTTFSSGGVALPTTTRSGGWYELSLKLHLANVTGAATTAAPTSAAPTTAMPAPPAPPSGGGYYWSVNLQANVSLDEQWLYTGSAWVCIEPTAAPTTSP